MSFNDLLGLDSIVKRLISQPQKSQAHTLARIRKRLQVN